MIKTIKNRKHETETEYYPKKKKDNANLKNNEIEYWGGMWSWQKKLKTETSAFNCDGIPWWLRL